ncbi:hypothetical protein Q3H58_001147 [Pseudomonas psychrotolerans]|nr:hypothetical protein [Pseudomonas psychrotolerans]
MSEQFTEQATVVGAPGGNKGLAQGSLGFLACVVLGISTIAPVYTLTGALGPTVREVGTQLPAVFLVGFLPMLLVALGYRELNAADPDSGTSFTWSARAFGPTIGWIGGWGMVGGDHHSAVQPGRGRGGFLLSVPGPIAGAAGPGRAQRGVVDQRPDLLPVHRPRGLDLLPRPGHYAGGAVRAGCLADPGVARLLPGGLQRRNPGAGAGFRLALVQSAGDRVLLRLRGWPRSVDLRLLGLGRLPHGDRGSGQQSRRTRARRHLYGVADPAAVPADRHRHP